MRSGPGRWIDSPLSSTRPEVGLVKPDTVLSKVLLPQPEWPITQTNSPA